MSLPCEYPNRVAYSSLNLGMAVQVICEILQAMTVVNDEYASEGWDIPKATASSIEHFFSHLESTLIDLIFTTLKIRGNS